MASGLAPHLPVDRVGRAVSGGFDLAAGIDSLPMSGFHRRMLILAGAGLLFDIFDTILITVVMPVLADLWKLSPVEVGSVLSSGFLGLLAGAMLFGLLADRIGRRPVFQMALLVYSLMTLLNTLAYDSISLSVLRFMTGLGLGGELVVVPTLLSELAPSRLRGRYVSKGMSFVPIGGIAGLAVSAVVIPMLGWRAVFVIGALPALLIVPARRSMVESPRWLESKGRKAEAIEVFKKIRSQIEARAKEPLPPLPEAPERAAVAEKFKLRELVGKNFRKRTIMLFSSSFLWNFAGFGFISWLPTLMVMNGYTLQIAVLTAAAYNTMGIPGFFIVGYLIDRLGRRSTIPLIFALGALFAYLMGQSISNLVFLLLWAAFFGVTFGGMLGAMATYTAENYPTRGRTTANGAVQGVNRVSAIFAPLTIGIYVNALGFQGILSLFAALLLSAGIVIVILGSETKQKRLEEVAL